MAGLTLDGYIRVSRVGGRDGDSFISPDVQRDQIAAWARLRGVTIAVWHTDLDVSGGTMHRPGLQAAMGRLRHKATGGIAVARLDRLSRASVVDALNVVEEIHDAGGQIAAVDLGIDPTTAFGEFAMTIMLALARMERRRISEQWRISRQRAVARGVHIASARPTGYQRAPDGRLEPHPTEAPVIVELFAKASALESWAGLARFLDRRRVEGPYGPARWTGRAVRHIIANRVYLGEARSGEFVNHQAHPPLVDRTTWERAQTPRGAASRSGEPALLSGLLRCAGCRHLMKPDRVTMADGTRARTYRCRGHHATGTCPDRPAVMGHIVEEHVQRLVLEEFSVMHAARDTTDSELDRAQDQAEQTARALREYRDDPRILATLGPDRYVEGLRALAGQADQAQATVAELLARRGPAMLDAETLGELWPDMTVMERRRFLTGVLDCVFLRSGRMPIGDRTLVFFRGTGPADLPRRGRRVPFGPLVWPDDPPHGAGVPVA